MATDNCEICGSKVEAPTDWAVIHRNCPRCGHYHFSSLVPRRWPDDERGRVLLSGWVREQNDVGILPTIDAEVSNRVQAMRMPGYRERAAKLLRFIATKKKRPDALFSSHELFTDLEMLGRTYSWTPEDANVLVKILHGDGYVVEGAAIETFFLTARGILAFEDQSASGMQFAQGFVAMSFSSSMADAWTNGFDPAIRSAGFQPMRIDLKEYVGGISDEIIAEIRRSRFVIADYTEQKNGVYFEAGFGLGLGLTIIPTCRADEIDKLHFDIRHLNTLTWADPNDLASRLGSRIIAVVGTGPHQS